MAARDPEERIASIAANTRWAFERDPSAATAPARRAFLDRFERAVDPDGVMDPAERAVRAARLRRAYFKRLAVLRNRKRRNASAT
jgi:hypothetical protein